MALPLSIAARDRQGTSKDKKDKDHVKEDEAHLEGVSRAWLARAVTAEWLG